MSDAKIEKLLKAKKINKKDAELLRTKIFQIEQLPKYNDLINNINLNCINIIKTPIIPTITKEKLVKEFIKSVSWSKDQITAIKLLFDFLFKPIKPFVSDDSDSEEDNYFIKKTQNATMSVSEDDYIFYLFGYAGTGKTFLVSELVKFLIDKKLIKYTKLSASTHKAVNVIKSRFTDYIIQKSQVHSPDDQLLGDDVVFTTIHKMLRLKNDYQIDDGKKIFIKNVKVKIFSKNGSYLIIVDECSMISDELTKTIFDEIKSEILKNFKGSKSKDIKKYIKMIFVGDPAQLPPVDEKVNSIIIKSLIKNEKSVNQYTMEKIMRSTDENIIKLSNHVRKWVFNNNLNDTLSVVAFKGNGVNLFHQYNDILNSRWFNHFLKHCINISDNSNNSKNKSAENSIILAWTNKCCDTYNNLIRKVLFKEQLNNKKLHIYKDFNKNKFLMGEHLILNDYYVSPNYEIAKESEELINLNQYVFHTSDQIKVTSMNEMLVNTGKKSLWDEYMYKYTDLMETAGENEGNMIVKKLCTDIVKLLEKLSRSMDNNYDVWNLSVIKLNSIDGPVDYNTKNIIPINIYVLKDHNDKKLEKNKQIFDEAIKNLANIYVNGGPTSNILDFDEDAGDELSETGVNFFIKDLWKLYYSLFMDPFSDIAYGYAITSHKSQGSTFGNVYVDVQNILANPNSNEAKRCLYTAITRASTKLNLII
jgi:hypothetical protein